MDFLENNLMYILIAGVAIVVISLLGEAAPFVAKIKSIFSNVDLPDLLDGEINEHDAVDAVNLLCDFLPEGPGEEVCKLVAPHLFNHDHKE